MTKLLRSDRGKRIPLSDHRDTSGSSRQCRSLVSALLRSALSGCPLDIQRRCPANARSCKHGGRLPGVSRKTAPDTEFSPVPTLIFYHICFVIAICFPLRVRLTAAFRLILPHYGGLAVRVLRSAPTPHHQISCRRSNTACPPP